MNIFLWDNEKNYILKKIRGVCFEQIVLRMENGLDVRQKLILGKNQLPILKAGLRKIKAGLGLTAFISVPGFTGIDPIGDALGFRLSGKAVSNRMHCLVFGKAAS